jgi:hypothetical protein
MRHLPQLAGSREGENGMGLFRDELNQLKLEKKEQGQLDAKAQVMASALYRSFHDDLGKYIAGFVEELEAMGGSVVIKKDGKTVVIQCLPPDSYMIRKGTKLTQKEMARQVFEFMGVPI